MHTHTHTHTHSTPTHTHTHVCMHARLRACTRSHTKKIRKDQPKSGARQIRCSHSQCKRKCRQPFEETSATPVWCLLPPMIPPQLGPRSPVLSRKHRSKLLKCTSQ